MLTGKGLVYGGSRARTEATGYGAVYFVERMLRDPRQSFDGKKVDRLRLGQCRDLHDREGAWRSAASVVACSDSNGYVVDEDGIDLDLIKEIKESAARAHLRTMPSCAAHGRGLCRRAAAIWDVPCDSPCRRRPRTS